MVQYKQRECRQAREKRKAFVCLCRGKGHWERGSAGAYGWRETGREKKGTEEDEITGWIT